MNAREFLKDLKQWADRHPFLNHPFLQRFVAGPLTRKQASRFALLYYPHIQRTRLYQANALGITPDERVQAAFAAILYDEYGRGDLTRSHLAQYRALLNALDIAPAALAEPPILPEMQAYIDGMMRLTQGSDWLAAVGAAGLAGEWPIPPYYRTLLQGLRTVPGLDDEALALFIGHIDLDVDHAQMIEEAVAPHIATADSQAALRRGVKRNLDARCVQLAGLLREVFGARAA